MDMLSIVFLIFLEGILSLDNALVLSVTVSHLPPEQQKKALAYGIWGAFLFRFLALFFISTLITMVWLKVVAATYLIYLGIAHFIFPHKVTEVKRVASSASFWRTIVTVELLDMAFSIDSVFAAVGTSASFTVIFIGGLLGIVMMRIAATFFISLVGKFPKLEKFAYIIIILIGVKLALQTVL